LYPDVAYGMEGDTPAWLMLIPNGLNHADHPDWGSWGGRYELYTPAPAESPANPMMTAGVPVEEETRPIWTNASDKYRPVIPNEIGKAVKSDANTYEGNQVTLWRWRGDFQNDFAARMDWCTKPYNEANHPPVAQLNQPEEFTVRSGEIFKLDAGGSYDPDGDALSYLWFQYPEAGTFPGEVKFGMLAENLYNVHTIRAPALTRYKRVIVSILPE
jgi:Protein of unknown function (DUF1593)